MRGDSSRHQRQPVVQGRYTVLLDFLRAEGLLAEPVLGQGVSDWLAFEFRRSHLTDEGDELVRQCHGTWNPAFSQGHTQRHLIQWHRKLAALRAAEAEQIAAAVTAATGQ